MLDHAKADHHIERAGLEWREAYVALDDPVALILWKIYLVGFDCGTEIDGSKSNNGIAQQNLSEAPRTTTRLKNLNFFFTRQLLNQFVAETTV